ncbi:hypothetical protein N8253_00400 [Pelagibacterales bacterium]|nr:hypothetical protein [Pelagibacterales bacterium]
MSLAKAEIFWCEGLVNPTPSVSVCKEEGCGFDPQSGMCVRPLGVPYDPSTNKCPKGSVKYNSNNPNSLCVPIDTTPQQNNSLLIILFVAGVAIFFFIINKSVKKTKEVYKSSTIPLKNKVKRKELETRLNELDEVKPAEHTYKKTAYVDDTEEINEVKKLERQIKIKKLQKELKDLEEE